MLSKCYPESIERFSEDIDLTFLGMNKENNYCDKMLKKIESIMTVGFFIVTPFFARESFCASVKTSDVSISLYRLTVKGISRTTRES